IRADAVDRLCASGSEDRFNSLLSHAEYVAQTLKFLGPLPDPLTSKERKRLIRLLRDAQPLAERAFPLQQPTPVGELLRRLKDPIAIKKGRRRDDDAIFARKMLVWGAQEVRNKRLDAQIRPLELFFLAVAVGAQPIPDLKESQRADWE